MNEFEDQDNSQQGSSTDSQSHQLSIRREDSAESDPVQSKSSEVSVTGQSTPPTQDPQRLLFTPPIDIFGTEEGLVLRADLPGVSIEGLELQIEDNKLTLFGRVKSKIPEQSKLLHQEYQVGDFYRSFILSDEVDYDRISAKMTHGVLEITLPRIPRAQPRKIHVQSD